MNGSTVRWAGIDWPRPVKVVTPPGDTRVADVQIRWWHPGAWLLVGRALLRQWGVLPHLCATCAGNGRLMARPGSLRRIVCPDCHGKKYARRPA